MDWEVVLEMKYNSLIHVPDQPNIHPVSKLNKNNYIIIIIIS